MMLLHQLFEQQVLQHPERVAVEFRDRRLTYGHLNDSANRLAAYIRFTGTLKSGTVALSLDKGPLVVVAVLAVLKAGLAWVPLPTDAPRLRIQKILEISQAGLVLTSQDTLHLTDGLTTNLVLDDLETDRKIQQQASANLPATVSPDDLCHVIFTSGSTGIPKGVMIEHRAVFHNARVLAELFALHEHTRTLQFAAYTFDVFGLDLFMTFFAGGCLVMGNVSDMMSDLTGFVNHTHVNYAQLTPTVISLLDPTSVPSLEVLASSGEPLTAEIVQQWRHRVRLINAYGPTETIVCTVQDMTAGDLADPQIIGTAIKGSEVLVMLEGCAEEAPLGTVGEICVGGIQLFRSYLGVDHSHSGFFFHRGSQKFYRTGDFGVVTQLSGAHNVIRCLGRQDSQVKVHGVRVDLGDVESAIGSHTVTRHCISLAPKSGPLQGRLAAVLTVDHVGGNWEQITTGVPEMNVLQPTESVQRERLRDLVACVQEMVPPQAVPSIWWVVDKFPLTVSGKLDRISVQRWLEGMTKQDYTQLMQAWHTEQEDSATSSGSVAIQRRLVGLCSRVLGVDVIAVNPHAPVLHIGFDSLTIIQLVSLARREGIDLNVQQALRESSISQLSASLSRERPTTARTGQSIDEEPFSLAPEGADLQELKASVAEQCHVAPDDVLDVYPCTQLQSGMMALAARRSDAYICVMSFLLSPKVDKTRFEVAWEQLQSGVPLLQNRIVHGLGAGGLLQATIRHRITPISDDVFNSTMSFGDSLCRGRVVWDDTAHAWKFIMKIHHSLFDGWTKGLMLLELKKIYESRDLPAPTVTPFKRVVAYLVEDINSNGKKHSLFWRHYLDGCDVTDFPRMTLKWTGELTSHHTLIHDINVDTSTTTKKFQVTATSVIQAAWALVLGKHTGTDDVAFGSTLSGRNLPVEDVDRIIGPTMTTVPCRVRWDRSTTLRSFLEQLHRHSVELISHQHYGLQDIASLGQDAKNACSFRSILVVQPYDTSADNLSDFIREEEHLGSDVLRTYPLAIEYIPLDSKSARIKAHYDENVVQKEMLLWVIRHFESALRKFGFADPEVAVADIEVMDRAEVEQVLALSRSHSPKIDRCLHELVQEAVDNFPDYVAIRQFSPPKTVSYRELGRLSNSLSRRLSHLYNVGVGDIVPLAFEKSALAIIAMMAVLKAGAAYVLLDASQPVQRLQQMTRLLKSRLTLCSSRCFPAMQNVGGQALEINDECLSETGLDLDPTDIHHMPASPCDLAVVFFTSGSTGQPKGVASSHSAFTTFTFDMGLKDIYCTLLSGGCICLPDEQDRLNPEAMREMDVNVAFLTPSIAETIEVEDVPNLQILNLGGERATASVIRKWADRVRLINSYGPTETVACLTAADWLTHDANPDHIGQAVTGQMWIVQRNSTGCIVPSPIGCVGEIAIAGFTVARGYLNDPVKSGEAFVEPPEWMWPAVAGSRLYLTGDLGMREPSGDVRYVGRNDRQVKIHGIRIEPTEAEHHLRRLGGIFTSAIVDSARLTEAESSLSLVAFVLVHGGRDEQETSAVIVDPEFVPVDFYTACQDAQVRLAERIPRHLVPKYFIPVHHFPLSSSSKTDRRRLRDALENDAHGDHHVAMNSTRGASERLPPQTKLERCVCEAWKTVLSAETPFGLNDDFFRVGGDSFAVIKLVLVCRKKGLQLSAADVYDRPTLARMAAAAVELPVAEKTKTGEAETPDPFSLLPGSVQSLLVEAAQVCDVDVEEIEDMYPASPFQEGLAAVNLHTKSAYMARWVYHLPGSADLDRLRTAMEFVIARNPILRTTLAHLSCGTTQVVLKYGPWTTKGHEEDAGIEGNRLFAYSLSRTDRGDTCLQIDMHHVLYDEWTVGFFLDDLVHNYSTPGSERQGRPGYAKFIRHLANTDYEASAAFWRGNLEHTSPSNFPRAPQSGRLPQTRAAVQSADQICLEESNRSAITPAVVSAAALAVLLSSYAQTEDVVFGVTLSGRHVPGLEEVAGPTISTVPLRLKKTGGGEQSTTTAADFLALVQSKMRALQDHHHFGLRRIRQLGGEGCRSACAFRTLLVVQQDARRRARAAGVLLDLRPVDEETSMSLNYGLVVLLCTDHATGSARFRIEYDPDSIAEQQARRVLRQLTEIARRLSSMQGTLGAIKADCGEGFEQPMQTEPQNGDVGSHGGKTALQTASQSRLRHIWANAMNLPPESIGASDTIYGLGGDSMTLIKLLYGARKKGFRLVVGGEVNQFTTLADMSRSLEEASRRLEPEGPARFSLVKGMSEQECIEDAAAKCNVDAARVEDVYPCTSLQEGLMALSSREAGSYVAQNCFKILGTDVDMNRLQSAILRVWHAEPILRTRIFVGAKLTTFQVVIRGDVGICQHGHALHEFLARDREIPFEYGQPLSRFALVDDGRGQAHLVLSQHHAVSDGWATNLLVNAIKREYGGAGQLNRVNRMPSFVKFVGSTQHSSEAALFWKTVLDGASATEFPHSRKNDGFRAAAWASTACSIARARGTALPTVLEAAWGLVLGRHAASDDVCFGTVRSGRTAAVPEIDSLMGPAIVTVPRRLKPQAALSVAQYLEQVYYQAAQALPFEQLGLQRIRELGEDARNACSFRTLLIIQPEQPALQDEPGGLALEQVDVESMVGTYALSTYCLLGEDGELTIRINYDDGVVCESEVRWIAYHFCQAATQLAERAGGLVGDVDLCGDEDRKQIACWNASKVDATEQRIEEAFRQRLGQWTGLSAVDGHDRRLTYAELDGAARSIAQLLRDRGVRCGDLVLVCMEKSALMVAALLGVFMAGAGYIPLAIDNPVDRLKSIVGQAPAQMLLCSRQQEPLCRALAPAAAAVLEWELLDGRPAAADGSTQKAQPTDLAYIMYTSGSTGVPKGVMLSHTALSTRMLAQGSRLGYRPGTRTLQFCSYAFDCSLTEMFMTLLHGGCVCVPTEEQRLTSLAAVINAERIDMAVLTATVVGGMLQHPDRVPGLSTLMLVGEPVTQHIVDAWSGRVRVINDYGPTEACVDAVINVGVGRDTDPANIGHPVAAYAWVVDAADRAKLAPVGCPGELLLAGPTLAVGYAGDTARTDAVFLPAARFPWARRDVARLYATGDVAKLRGLRVELREIEFLLEKADHIAAAVADVVAGQALVAFVAVESGARAVLPLASIPMTAARSDLATLRRLWADVLAVDADMIGINADFVVLGGNSHPVLEQMALHMAQLQPQAAEPMPSMHRRQIGETYRIANIEDPRAYVATEQFLLAPSTDVARFKAAWDAVVCSGDAVPWSSPDEEEDMGLGSPLVRFSLQGRPPFRAYVQHLLGLDRDAATSFWAKELAGADADHYPRLPPGRPWAETSQSVELVTTFAEDFKRTLAFSNVARAAWALVLAVRGRRPAPTHDVCFGAVASGRMEPVLAVEDMAGPTLATVPNALETAPCEHVGLRAIAGASRDAEAACRATPLCRPVEAAGGTGMMLQPYGIEMRGLLDHFSRAVGLLVDPAHGASQMLSFNGPPLPRLPICLHELTLSYAELDRAASRLAAHLQRRFGVGPRKLVPLCFEKSSYMVIAMLAVHEQTGADLVLVSAAQQRRVVDELVGASVFVVDAAACRERAGGGGTPEPCTGPHDVAYVIFTSGSTGRPKGVVMEHGSPFRTLQFSSYAFDVSVAEVFATLAFGGAVCVPADDERLSNLPGVVASMQVGVAFLTPTMAGAMRPEEAPSLELLCLTGEARTPSAVRAWTSWASSAAQRRLFDAVERDTPPNNIGSPFGGQLWIVDAEDHTRLLPVGCAGELVISGATLARGYLNNAEETAKAFIDHVSWLEDGEARRIYKTGDVGRFACDGTIEFLGRKDGRQVKLHGVRVELSDVEAALQSCEAATPEIMAMAQHADDERPELIAPSPPPSLKSWIRATLGSLRRLLPAYMIPSLLLPVPVWPRTTSGKTDRRMLCNAASSLVAGVLSLYQAAGSAEPEKSERGATLNRAERAKSKQKMLGSNRTSVAETHDQVADSWRRALRRDSEIRIMAEDDFFAAGGDSVSAIFLVAELRRKNMHITVSDVYRCRSLGDMVDLVLSAHEDDDCVGATTKPFSLLQQPAGSQLQHLLDDAASQLGIDSNSIEDMYPCTPLQNGIMFLSERVTGSYHGHFRLLMPRKLDVNRLYHAFEKLVEMHDILRTRIIFDRSFGGLQVVLSSAAHLKTLRKFTEREKTTAFRYGSPLYRYTLTAGGDGIYLELVCHHSMYDGWSLPLLVEDLRCLYHDIDFSPDPTTPFKDMVAYACDPSIIRAAEEFWDVYLDGAAVSDFPEVADRVHHSIRATAYHERAVTAIEKKASQRITMATILAAAWSIVVSRHAGSSDVCFGVLLSGRNAPVAGIEGIRGPTINTVPFRVVLDPASTTTSAVLEQVQSHMVAMIPHQFIDLAKLRKAFAGARQDFGSLLAIQSAGSSSTDGGGRDFSLGSAPSEKAQVGAMFGEPYPLFLEATTVAGPGNDVLLAAQFDPEILSIGHVERILGQYETAIRLLAGVELGSTLVSEAALLSASDEQCLRDWAGEPIQPEADCVHQMIERFAAAHPEKQAIEGCGEHVTYAQLEQRANSLADHLLRLGKNVGPGMIVPVWMETSPTAVVALLSILKLGASYVPLDHRLPVARAQSIANDVAADVMLVSKEMSDAASQVVRQISDRGVTVVQPSDLAYVIYTSGSTGEPKGVMMEHWALTATVKAQAATYGFDCTTRMFGLASLSWDPSILEIFATLSHGGCLCIPTERERSQDLVGAINRLRADQISTSPAVASLIDLCATPTVKVIALGGEVVREENIRNAHEAGVRLFNIYGPSEACIDAIVHRNVVPGVDTRNIGRPMSSQVWIVDPGNPRRLVPPGCVGEIALSGTLARGYLNDAVKTASRFVTDCPYASPVYLTGDLGRHHVDGSVYFLGRKDRQVKLNGQRVELGEIDDAIRTLCPGTQVAVDYFSTTGDAKKRLVVFSSSSPSSPPPERGDRGRALVQLPRYMVPRIFITVSYLPLSNADKVDFHALRAAYTRWEEKSAASVDQDAEFPPPSPPSTPSLTTAATMLRSMWASVIGCPEQSIRAHDDIFDLGADSLTVLKLATLARTKGISMSVADVYASPTLLHMARLVPSSVADESSPVGDNLECPPKFSLLPDFIRKRLLEKGTESDNEVIDAYPCTTIQTTSLIQGQKRHKAHYAWFLLQIKGSADELHLRKACGLLSERHSALRTTFRIIDGQFIQQLHKRPRIDFQKLEPCDSVEAFCSLLDQNVPNPVNFDQVLTRYRIAEYADGRGYLLAIGMSHAQYDGFCWSTILNDLQQASMSNGGGKPSPPFSRFIGHMLQTSRDVRTQSFWRDLLRGCTMTTFTGPAEQTHLRRVLDRKHVGILPRYDTRPGNATFAMIVKSAWAIVLSCLSGSADVTFGSLVFGRDPEVAGVGEMVGACINVVPNRVSLADGRENWTASDLLEHVRRQQVEMGPFETTPLPTICRSADWPSTTRFGSIVQHQNIDESVFASTGTMDPASSSSDKWNYLGNASYPGVCDDVIDCWITTVPLPDETRLEFAYNRSSISDDVAASITSHLCDTVRAIYEDPRRRLSSLRPPRELNSLVRIRLNGNETPQAVAEAERDDHGSVPEGERQNHLMNRLRELWSKVLPLPESSASSSRCIIDDNDISFFAIGGDSGSAMQLAAICESEGLELGVQGVFDCPTRRLQAARLLACGHQTKAKEKIELIFEPKLG
ncbi:Nonribosomal peptide synthase [Lasiodiplodia theobromae]|uniref:Nonribosomal peptide synthase n=1 Tax=Lasiodiplodia theobromae TaxID=45133 RepID=UPI0015C406CD|nr:Nonribosomal peptide synthase [Lasiodiplodia theobromae]KAF4544380.1 Nonribosomal peptide synthase [Lasiodiplodia theobromae]